MFRNQSGCQLVPDTVAFHPISLSPSCSPRFAHLFPPSSGGQLAKLNQSLDIGTVAVELIYPFEPTSLLFQSVPRGIEIFFQDIGISFFVLFQCESRKVKWTRRFVSIRSFFVDAERRCKLRGANLFEYWRRNCKKELSRLISQAVVHASIWCFCFNF